jgi:hypothetical protein
LLKVCIAEHRKIINIYYIVLFSGLYISVLLFLLALLFL